MQRGVVTAHRLVAGVHQGKAFLLCPEQRGRREKTCSQCVISLDMQHKATLQRANNEIHQAKISKKRSRNSSLDWADDRLSLAAGFTR